MYQQATEILPFAATLWKDVKFNGIRLEPLLFYDFICLIVFVLLCFSSRTSPLQLFSWFMRFSLCVLLFLNSGFHFLFSCSQFLMFELARSGNGSAVQEILVNSRHVGVELEEFFNTLLGK